MTSHFSFAKLFAALIVLGLTSSAVPAMARSEGPYEMEVLINGRPAREFYARGKTYVEAKNGYEYSIRLSNRTGERVAVALAVDGMNTIDAKHTSAASARKWVLDPWQTLVVDGWQTSNDTARHFYFTGEASSYGAWMGKTRDLGNISAAFFQEVRPVPQPYYAPEEYDYDGNSYREESSARRSGGRGADTAPSDSAKSAAPAGSAGAMQSEKRSRSMAKDDELAATGIGREVGNDVYTVDFRQSSSPSAVVTVRYEFRDKLVQLGIIPPRPRPAPMYRRETSSGFTDYGYAPDPYRQ